MSADAVRTINCKGKTLYELNLYAYCDNNPIIRADASGYIWIEILAADIIDGVASIVAGAVIGAVDGAINYYMNVEDDASFDLADLGESILRGAGTGAAGGASSKYGHWSGAIVAAYNAFQTTDGGVFTKGTAAALAGVTNFLVLKFSNPRAQSITGFLAYVVDKVLVNGAIDMISATAIDFISSINATFISDVRKIEKAVTKKKPGSCQIGHYGGISGGSSILSPLSLLGRYGYTN